MFHGRGIATFANVTAVQTPRVRQAIAHAVDRDWITKNIWYGRGTPATGPNHRRAGSEALLDEAGFKRGTNDERFALTIDPPPVARRISASLTTSM